MTIAPIAYFITYGLGDYGGGPPPTPPATPTLPDGGWGIEGRESRSYKRIAKRIEYERSRTEQIRREIEQAFNPEAARAIVDGVTEAIGQDEPKPSVPSVVPPAQADNALLLMGRMVEILLTLEELDSRLRFMADEEDAVIALLLIA